MPLGKLLIIAGIALVLLGVVLLLLPMLHGPGKLPGDIVVKRGNFTLYFPLAASVIVSVLLSLLLWIFRSK